MTEHSVEVVADSICRGHRIFSVVARFPRIILAEVNTHCMIAKSSASSRAISIDKMIAAVEENPYVPQEFGVNRRGMQATETLSGVAADTARELWLKARDNALQVARSLQAVRVHKQTTNRLLEPFMWHTAILTATDWSNFFHLRNHPDAHPDFRIIAALIQGVHNSSTPIERRTDVSFNDWHAPFLAGVRNVNPYLSAARCARVSYTTHDGRHSEDADLALAHDLVARGHMSPFEHVARPMTDVEYTEHRRFEYLFPDGTLRAMRSPAHEEAAYLTCRTLHYSGKFDGWVYLRKTIPYEYDKLAPQCNPR